MKKIKVYDAIMGSGKTYNAIERMKKYVKSEKKFIYITPFLSEVDRIIERLPDGTVYAPTGEDDSGKAILNYDTNLIDSNGQIDLNKEPLIKRINKREHFFRLLSEGKCVVSTHSLFLGLKKEDYSFFSDYILILDEVVTPLKAEYIGEQDINIMIEQNLISVDEKTNEVRFVKDEYSDPLFKQIKYMLNSFTVFLLDQYFFVWVFPIEIFKELKEVEILTYLFEGSLLCAYFKVFNIDYTLIRSDETLELEKIKKLLNVYEGRANQSKHSMVSFSESWCKKVNKSTAKKMSKKATNIFKRRFKTSSKENAFTTFKNYKSKFSGNSYRRGFIPVNSRATNEYRNIKSMAYFANRYFTPQITSFFRERDVELNQDLWSLGELLQWVWRGCIRDSKEMNLFIPSYRMRSLLYKWLDGEFLLNVEDKTNLKIA